MITSEEINGAKTLIGEMTQDDYSALVVLVNKESDTKMMVCGEPDDIVKLLERLENYCCRYTEMLKAKGGSR